jgi:hypothetical protein
VRFTPPRTGTFIYHTHLHDHQLASGLYGALVVVEAGETFDPAHGHERVVRIESAIEGPGKRLFLGSRHSLTTCANGPIV